MPPPVAPPTGYRVRVGDSFAVVVTSSIVMSLTGFFRVVYDSGKEDNFDLRTFTTVATRTVELAVANRTCMENGYVVEGVLLVAGDSAATPKRGQTYCQMLLGQNVAGSVIGTRQIIGCGYLYGGYAPTLGVFVEPGPGGGEGMFLLNPIINAETVGADFIVNLDAPSNTIRAIGEIRIRYTCSATVGTRNVRVSRFDEDGVELWRFSPDTGPTANQTVDIILSDMLVANFAGIGANVTQLQQTRQIWLPEGHVLRIEDTGDISATDTVSVFGDVQEWVVL